jgi:hypothetical protein
MDVVLGAFSAFFMQNESFLEHQRQLHSRWGRNNAQTLFAVFKIPSSAQIWNVLDGISASGLFPIFGWVYQALKQRGCIKSYLGSDWWSWMDANITVPQKFIAPVVHNGLIRREK